MHVSNVNDCYKTSTEILKTIYFFRRNRVRSINIVEKNLGDISNDLLRVVGVNDIKLIFRTLLPMLMIMRDTASGKKLIKVAIHFECI